MRRDGELIPVEVGLNRSKVLTNKIAATKKPTSGTKSRSA
jgi:hypothetical protein